MHSIPITFSFVLASDYFRPRFRALGWWNVSYVCFCFGRPHTTVPERANRSDGNHVSLLPSPLLLVFPVIVGQSRVGVSSGNFKFWQSSGLNSRLGFSWLLMLHFTVRTREARTPTFLSVVHWLFWLFAMCCYAPSVLVTFMQVTRLRQVWFASPSEFSLLSVFWLGQFRVFDCVWHGHFQLFFDSVSFGRLTWSVLDMNLIESELGIRIARMWVLMMFWSDSFVYWIDAE
jgi:hypothetical protein